MEITDACDAFLYGLMALLSHTMEDSSKMPIFSISMTLAPTENYAQIDKGVAALFYGAKKFH